MLKLPADVLAGLTRALAAEGDAVRQRSAEAHALLLAVLGGDATPTTPRQQTDAGASATWATRVGLACEGPPQTLQLAMGGTAAGNSAARGDEADGVHAISVMSARHVKAAPLSVGGGAPGDAAAAALLERLAQLAAVQKQLCERLRGRAVAHAAAV